MTDPVFHQHKVLLLLRWDSSETGLEFSRLFPFCISISWENASSCTSFTTDLAALSRSSTLTGLPGWICLEFSLLILAMTFRSFDQEENRFRWVRKSDLEGSTLVVNACIDLTSGSLTSNSGLRRDSGCISCSHRNLGPDSQFVEEMSTAFRPLDAWSAGFSVVSM